MKPAAHLLLITSLLVLLGSDSRAATNQTVQSEQTTRTLRDPFWPVGFSPAAPAKTETADRSDEAEAPLDADTEWPPLSIQGRSRSRDGTYLALIEGIGIVRPGEQVAIQRDDLWFTWQIDAINSQGVQIRRIGVSRTPPEAALTPR